MKQNTRRLATLRRSVLAVTLLMAAMVSAQEKRIPPPGIKIDDKVRQELLDQIKSIRGQPAFPSKVAPSIESTYLVADWFGYIHAVESALQWGEFMEKDDLLKARRILQLAEKCRDLVESKKLKEIHQPGLHVHCYVSRIDRSEQPFGLLIPADYQHGDGKKRRLDIWWHGRDEKLTEIRFIEQRLKGKGEFTPEGAFVLFPYGRFCNANKFAGEIDTFEAIEWLKRLYPIDETRIVARGFSMGGAACWHMAAHHPSFWCAAAPGAGFSETPEYLRNFENDKVKPTWYQEKLFRWYDATNYAGNFHNLAVVAYSGEIDKQKQAADVMAKAMKAEGLELTHLIGPGTAHKYHPETKKELIKRIDEIVLRGHASNDHIQFATYTLRYPECAWLRIDGLEKHWEKATVEGTRQDMRTKNVSALTVNLNDKSPATTIDGQKVNCEGNPARFVKDNGKWRPWEHADSISLRKSPGLQGPIDDAFLDSFIIVRPTGKPAYPQVHAWATAEMERFIKAWRSQFRGVPRVVDDVQVSADMFRESNLILWGDPGSNKLIATMAQHLPVRWADSAVICGDKKFDPQTHAPIFICPSPRSPKRYIVVNSGFTFREDAMSSNARQIPKLPDFAIVDIRTPPDSHNPGKIVEAGFFDERWKLP